MKSTFDQWMRGEDRDLDIITELQYQILALEEDVERLTARADALHANRAPRVQQYFADERARDARECLRSARARLEREAMR